MKNTVKLINFALAVNKFTEDELINLIGATSDKYDQWLYGGYMEIDYQRKLANLAGINESDTELTSLDAMINLSSLTGHHGNIQKWIKIERKFIEWAESNTLNPVNLMSYRSNPGDGFVLTCVLGDLEGYGYLGSNVSLETIDAFIKTLDKLENPKSDQEASSFEKYCYDLSDIVDSDESGVLPAIISTFNVISNLNSYWQVVVEPVISYGNNEVISLANSIEHEFTSAAVDVLVVNGVIKTKSNNINLKDEHSSFNIIKKYILDLRGMLASKDISIKRDILELDPLDHNELSAISHEMSMEWS